MAFAILPLPPSPAPIRWLTTLIELLLVAIGGVMVVLVFANIVMHLFNRDIAWTTELCEFLMVWASFLGGASAARRGLHMTITEFIEKLTGASRRLADAAVQVLCLVVLAILVWFGLGIVQSNWGNVLTVLDWPMALQYLALPVGAGASLVFVAYDLALILRGRSAAERYGA